MRVNRAQTVVPQKTNSHLPPRTEVFSLIFGRIGIMQIKAILFDLDDTLWPLLPLINHAERMLYGWMQDQVPNVTAKYDIAQLRSMRSALIPTNPRFRYDLWALRHTALTQIFREQGEDIGKVDAAMQVFAAARNQVAMYQDVVPGLIFLKQHVTLGSISNGFADLTEIGLASHFNVSLAAHQFGCAKPEPAIFLAACAALNVTPQQTLYVGDDLVCDVQGSQQAGLQSVWMNRAKLPLRPEFTPDYECHDMQDLIRLVQQNFVS
jgi:putative hydrolase of the HAD superfamily